MSNSAGDLVSDAQMISAGADWGTVPILSKSVVVSQDHGGIRSARLAATAHGAYEAFINGESVADSLFNPGWTSYRWRLQVQEFDVTDMVASGEPDLELSARLGNGWFRGKIGFEHGEIDYAEEIGFVAALEIVFADGYKQTVPTDESWSGRRSDVTENSIYHGETIDARLRTHAEELPIRVISFDRSSLTPQIGPLVRRQGRVHAVEILKSPSGKTLVDFGQNLVGWVTFSVQGAPGVEIVVRHAEVLEDGELGTRPLRAARATDTFILSGNDDSFEPNFTFHGFRYIEVNGWPGQLTLDDIEAVVVHSDLRRTGEFECSNPMVNQLIENVVWSQRGNFLDIPTDCPQRDERLGWTGDIAVFSPTASFQFNVSDFLHKWLLDLRAETEHSVNGTVPIIVPDLLKEGLRTKEFSDVDVSPTAIWGDAAVWVPQALWNAYGDEERLAEQYPAMVLHLRSVERRLDADGLWTQGFQFGDWLDPEAPPEHPGAAKADTSVVATACLYRSASFAAEAARVIGKTEDAGHWRALAERTRKAFNDAFVEDGRVRSDCATVYSLAVCFGLLDEPDRAKAVNRLAELVRNAGYRVSTGFAGTPYVTWALSENGHVEDAYRLLTETDCPSWMYPVTMGATTVWERWDSMLPDGSINPGEMTSFNHYALGAVADWIYQVVGGIRPAEPGYARVLIKPEPGEGIEWAHTSYESAVGHIETFWKSREGEFSLALDLPGGVPADVVMPNGAKYSVVGGSHRFGARLE